MGTLADEERQFLLKATGLPENATLNDLQYVYFKRANSGEIGLNISEDTSSGNRLYLANGDRNYLISADTGWVNATTWTVEGAVSGAALPVGTAPSAGKSGYIKFRRKGDEVKFKAAGLDITGSAPVFSIPPAFRPGTAYSTHPIATILNNKVSVAKVGTDKIYTGLVSGDVLDPSYATVVVYETNLPWPSSI